MDAHEKPMGMTEVSKADEPEPGRVRSKISVRRLFSFSQMFFFALSYMSSWEALATNIGLVFYNGGPRAVVWGFFIVVPGILAQVASMAEMSSVQPIAGAQYHWTWHFAPPRYKRFITWMQGWITWFSWISLLASIVNIAANVTTTIITASFPQYTVQGWHTILIMYAYLITLALLNTYAFRIVPFLEIVSGVLHIVSWIVFAAVLLTLAPKHTTDFVFFEEGKLSGWQNDFVSFNLGILLVTWGFVGFDATAHIAEETRRARFVIPRAMFWSICMNAGLAFAMTLIFLYCLGNIDGVLNSTYPLMAICLHATKSVPAASAMVGALLSTVVLVSIGSITSASRLTWAWARDGVLPEYFSYVSPTYRVPTRSVWLPVVIVMLLSLLNLANYTAFSVIIALSTFGLYQSYFIAIACMLHARLTRGIDVAPWSLGRFGVPINAFALIYTAWIGVFMVFPSYLPVTAAYMNYALPINAVVWIVAIAWWFAWGRRNWRGLDIEVVEKVVADGDRDTKD